MRLSKRALCSAEPMGGDGVLERENAEDMVGCLDEWRKGATAIYMPGRASRFDEVRRGAWRQGEHG